VTYETVRCWTNKFGPAIAANIRRRRGRADNVWHLDEMAVRIGGKRMFMWLAVDVEGEVLDVQVQTRRNKAAMRKLGCLDRHNSGQLQENKRAENSHLPVRRRERKMQRFKTQGQAQRFVSTHSAIYNTFYIQRQLTSRKTMRHSRSAAMAEWNTTSAAGA
jgi:transposase-like protein